MKIEKMKIGDVIPYENNVKLHPKEQIDQIKSSIVQFGNNDPIAVDANNVIIEGHGRLMALQELGYEEVEVIRLGHLTEEQRKAYTLVHNQLTMNSGFDIELLKLELDEIVGIDMTEFDFDFEIDEPEPEVSEDEFEGQLPDVPKSKLGEVYQLGSHRLMCGDSTSKPDITRLMDKTVANMVFTDPPYGYEYQSNMRTKSEKFEVLTNDDKILDFFPMLQEFNSGFIFICTAWKVLDKWIPLFKSYYALSNMIIWDKGGGGIGDLKHTFSTDYEVILCSNNGNEITGKRIGSVWSLNKEGASTYVHPTQKPVSLSALAIENTTNAGDIVLDLFGGSGSTLVACEQLGRRCFMMEYEPKYVDVIIDRWEAFTGEKAVKLKRKTQLK